MFSAARVSARVKVVQTLNTWGYSTWTSPGTTSRLESVIGWGANGSPATPDTTETGWQENDFTYAHYKDGSQVTWFDGTGPEVYDGSPKPADYFGPTNVDNESTVYSDETPWHRFFDISRTVPGDPATTGESSTAFGLEFYGGDGGPAGSSLYNNVAITPNTPYQIYIPAGGSITITYYK